MNDANDTTPITRLQIASALRDAANGTSPYAAWYLRAMADALYWQHYEVVT